MPLRRRLCWSPLLLLLGVALGLFYQTLNGARNRIRIRLLHTTPDGSSEEGRSFISALETVQVQAQPESNGPGPGLGPRIALVLTGQHASTDTEVQLYQRVLQQLGYEVRLSRYAETSSLLRLNQDRRVLALLLCLSSSETSCLRRVSFSELQIHQKVNLLPQLLKAFSDAGDGLCHLFTHKSAGLNLQLRPQSCQKHHESISDSFRGRRGAVLSVYIVVTSADPVTSFLHDTVVLTSAGETRGKPGQLSSLRPGDVGYSGSYQTLMIHMKSVIWDVLQASVHDEEQSTKRCLLCYQLLTFTLLFDAPRSLSIVQVDTDWTFSALNAETFDQEITKDLMLEDVLHFLLEPQTASPVGTKPECREDDGCARAVGVSLSDDDLRLLLHFHQRIKQPGPFQPVFTGSTLCSSAARPRSVSDLLIKTTCYYELRQNHSLRTTEAESLGSIGHTARQENALCSDPRLRQIYTDPPLALTPVFDPGVKEYHIEVPFQVVMVRIRPEPVDSRCHVHLDERHGPRMASLPLGLGHSRINVLVTDGGRPELVLTVYSLRVFRESRPSLPMFGDHVLCSFTQECGFPVRPDQSCGLEPFNKSLNPPAPCDSGDSPGEWVLPCLSCQDERTCDWREIVWRPRDCHHPGVEPETLQECLADTKLLFIGDSTNRGMMYFLMERVNSSLQDWEKAHDTLTYRNLNSGRTLVSYSYYPQFWLESSLRPTFAESLDTLLDRSQPLFDSRRTVLVVGGVQWLNTNHLRVVRDTLDRKGLSDVLVVVKSLGMGFHLLVDGIRSLTLSDVQDLFRENQELLAAAKKFGFEVIDTFSITMGRYKEFLQGRCACHFHEVEKQQPSSPGLRGLYKVKGPVNQVYSEILLSRLCPS